MNDKNMEEVIFGLEYDMWKSASNRDVVSLWKKVNNLWKLYFNMDSRIITGKI